MSWMTPFSRACVTGTQDFTATMLLHLKVAAQTSGVLHCLLLLAVSAAWLSMHTSQLCSPAFGGVQVQLQFMTNHYAACTLRAARMHIPRRKKWVSLCELLQNALTTVLSCLSHHH